MPLPPLVAVPPQLRTIIETSEASAEIDRLKLAHPRFEDWWEYGWKWRLSRDPFRDAQLVRGKTAQGYLLRTGENHAANGIPFALTILYAITDKTVEILALRSIDL
jgi:hypothetical protein